VLAVMAVQAEAKTTEQAEAILYLTLSPLMEVAVLEHTVLLA
jgi:hypothetical protein